MRAAQGAQPSEDRPRAPRWASAGQRAQDAPGEARERKSREGKGDVTVRRDEGLAKEWERQWARRLPPDKPWIVRLDGRGFHRWTRGLERPLDARLREAMVRTAEACADDANAWHAYTQSDEVTLVLERTEGGEPAFGGKLQKMVSLLAARASITFNDAARALMPEHAAKRAAAVFDARAFAVPDRASACTALAERALDCWRNAVQSAGQARYGHRTMLGLKTAEVRERLERDGTPMSHWARAHTGGVALVRHRVRRRFEAAEIERLPPRHAARSDPDLKVERTETERLEGPDYRDTGAAMRMIFSWRDEVVER